MTGQEKKKAINNQLAPCSTSGDTPWPGGSLPFFKEYGIEVSRQGGGKKGRRVIRCAGTRHFEKREPAPRRGKKKKRYATGFTAADDGAEFFAATREGSRKCRMSRRAEIIGQGEGGG